MHGPDESFLSDEDPGKSPESVAQPTHAEALIVWNWRSSHLKFYAAFHVNLSMSAREDPPLRSQKLQSS